MGNPLVIYHDTCMDGFAAAWVAREAFLLENVQPEFMPHQYGRQFDPKICRNRPVYLLDYSFKLPVMKEIQERSSMLVILDHHKTAEAEIAGLVPRQDRDIFRFDMNRSGASMAWSHFFGGDVPPFIRHVEDRDLWRFALPDTEAIMDAVASYPYDFESYGRLAEKCSSPAGKEELLREGRAIGRWKNEQVKIAVSQAREVELDGYRVLAVNQSVANLLSQVAGELAQGRPFGLAYFQAKEGHWVYSLRSKDPDGIDVAVLAKRHGGGGHKNAAGFQSPELLV